MSVRVDLLKPAEHRYQGAVSRDFAVQVAAWGGGSLLILLVLIGFVNSRVIKHQLHSSRQMWDEMQPRYERVRLMQEQLTLNKRVKDELDAWHSARIQWSQHLVELQRFVPPEVQMTKLTVQGEIKLMDDPAAKDDKTDIPVRVFRVRVEGRTGGDLADEVVVSFVNHLRDDSSFKGVLDSVKLQGLQRAGSGKGKDAQRLFGIEGISLPREM